MAAGFQSVTLRTAGFDTIGQGDLTPAGQMVSIILIDVYKRQGWGQPLWNRAK